MSTEGQYQYVGQLVVDFRLDGLVLPLVSNAVVTLKPQSSDDLEVWADTVVVPNVQVDLTAPIKYFRFQAN